ncbi:MAG: hypothetical protein BGO38_03340 [Cellulomonas sp. 73-145]|uniref:hypothetical protein n=1 Tax=Cellulomonas sp. 73-145 TaxID=1895739 RepID=UPI0009280131|nr:hypothetical protein [Cellulomonas sp. 73-145]MBN9327745.1 hypothetical protein [Cellulomonas sp.]OJV56977.1 MAG: hypothetical protein BGO38_03340 [Cellulomonas sp. 73-145]
MSGGSELRGAATETPTSSLLGSGAGLVMIETHGPALVCADGVCAPADADDPLAAAAQGPADDELANSAQ